MKIPASKKNSWKRACSLSYISESQSCLRIKDTAPSWKRSRQGRAQPVRGDASGRAKSASQEH